MDKNGGDNALWVILGTFAHEIGHYYQWIDDELDDEDEEADNNKEYMLDLYADIIDHP